MLIQENEKKKKQLFILISSKDIAIQKQFFMTVNSLLHFPKLTPLQWFTWTWENPNTYTFQKYTLVALCQS